MRFIKHLLIIVICVFGVMHTNTSFAYDDEGGESGGGETVQCTNCTGPGMVCKDTGCECRGDMNLNGDGTACEIDCDSGTFLPAGGTSCVSCVDDSRVRTDQYCPGGTFKYSETDNQKIENCGVGGSANSGKTGCEIECVSGQYLQKNDTTCSPCPGDSVSQGKYCPGGGPYPYPNDTDQGLKSCPEPSEDNKAYYIESNNCIICPAGSQCSKWQKTECPAGTFSKQGSLVCTKCGPGTYSDSVGSSSCTSCDAGKISNNDGTSCETCSDGTYAEGNVCKECHAGYYCKNGIETECPAETISRNTGWDTCVACSDAGFVANDAHTECVPQFINGETTWKFPDFMKIIR